MSHTRSGYKNYSITGRWKTIGVNSKSRIGMWKSKKYDQALLFQFQKNGQINVYVDQDDDWNFGRKKDRLIGINNNFDKKNFSKDFFYSKERGDLVLQANYGGEESKSDGYEYWLDLYKGKPNNKAVINNDYRFVDLRQDAYEPMHLWFHNGDSSALLIHHH